MSTRTCFRALCVVLLACAAPSHGGDVPAKPATAGEEATPVHAALAVGDARRALELLKDPTIWLPPAERRSLEGRARFILGDYVLARRKLESALRLRPNEPNDLYWLGRSFAAAGAHLLADGFRNGRSHTLGKARRVAAFGGVQLLDQIVRSRQAAGVGGQDAVSAASHWRGTTPRR